MRAPLTDSVDDAARIDIRPFMAGFPTGVAVITAVGADGRPRGMTCTSVCSVSVDPPTLLVCLRRTSPTLESVLVFGVFALNLLHHDARPTAELFASGAPDRFARVAWHLPTGWAGPHLTEAAHLIADCRVVHTKTVGDHTVVFGEVQRVTRRCDARPLLYGLRQYSCWPGSDE